MKNRYLEITFRKGKPLAAYLYLTGRNGVNIVETKKYYDGIVVDYSENHNPVGIEITSPHKVTIEQINNVLHDLSINPISDLELAPLKAA